MRITSNGSSLANATPLPGPRDADGVAAVREQHLDEVGVRSVILDQQAPHVRRLHPPAAA